MSRFKYLGRILGVIGLVLLLSSVLTWIIGATTFAVAKIALATLFFAFFFATNFGELGKDASSKGTFFFGVSALSSVVVIALLAALNYIAAKNPVVKDLTKNQIHTLSPDTVSTLQGLKQDVSATAFYKAGEPEFEALNDLFKRYAAQNEHFKFEFVDPIKDPLKTQQFGVRAGGPRVVVKLGNTESRFQEINEEALTNAVVKVTHSSTKKVYFITGHGEADLDDTGPAGLSEAKKRMENEGLAAEKLNLASTTDIPQDAQAVVVAGPAKPYLENEVATLKRFLDAGGKAYVMVEPLIESGLEGLLREYNVIAEPSVVIDPISRLFGASEAIPVVQNYSTTHAITKEFKLNTLYPTARPLTVSSESKPGLTTEALATSMPSAWGESEPNGKVQRDENEKGGPFPLVVAVTRDTKQAPEGATKRSDQGRLVVAGDRDFSTNKFSKAYGNEDFFLNSLNWLSEQTERITIRPRQRDASRLYLTETQKAAIFIVAIDALPVLLIAAGLTVWLVRRSK